MQLRSSSSYYRETKLSLLSLATKPYRTLLDKPRWIHFSCHQKQTSFPAWRKKPKGSRIWTLFTEHRKVVFHHKISQMGRSSFITPGQLPLRHYRVNPRQGFYKTVPPIRPERNPAFELELTATVLAWALIRIFSVDICFMCRWVSNVLFVCLFVWAGLIRYNTWAYDYT